MEVSLNKQMTRAEFIAARNIGRKFCWATLYERQDYELCLGGGHFRPIREITDEAEHWDREIGR